MEVKQITRETAQSLICDIHYAKRMPCIKYVFGLFEGVDLVGVVSFGPPSSPQVARSVYAGLRSVVLELNRLVITTNARNAASFLIGRALRLIPTPWVVVSYADMGRGHKGYVYQATNFKYAGLSKPHDAEYIINGKRVHPRTLTARGIKNPVEWARQNGINRVSIEPKHRYVVWKGAADKDILWKFMPYPKGDSQRYPAPNYK
jgi:hypothetical protein